MWTFSVSAWALSKPVSLKMTGLFWAEEVALVRDQGALLLPNHRLLVVGTAAAERPLQFELEQPLTLHTVPHPIAKVDEETWGERKVQKRGLLKKKKTTLIITYVMCGSNPGEYKRMLLISGRLLRDTHPLPSTQRSVSRCLHSAGP